MRYTDDSPIPYRLASSETGVWLPLYRPVSSFSWSSDSFRSGDAPALRSRRGLPFRLATAAGASERDSLLAIVITSCSPDND
jgi:hypothetical protein